MPYKDPAKRAASQRRIRPPRRPLPVKYGTAAHLALSYLKMRRTFVDPFELACLTPKLREYQRVVDSLVKAKCAVTNDRDWVRVTPKGIAMLYEIAQRRATRSPGDDEDEYAV